MHILIVNFGFWISLHGDKRRELFGQRERDIA